MKFQQLVVLAILLAIVHGNTREDSNEGLCLTDTFKNCSQSLQKYGVCCEKGGSPRWNFYRNYCLACSDGCITFRLLSAKGSTCDSIS